MRSLCTTYACGMGSVSLRIRSNKKHLSALCGFKYAIQGKSPPQTEAQDAVQISQAVRRTDPSRICNYVRDSRDFCESHMFSSPSPSHAPCLLRCPAPYIV